MTTITLGTVTYEIERVLGEGTAGTVILTKQPNQVVIKFFSLTTPGKMSGFVAEILVHAYILEQTSRTTRILCRNVVCAQEYGFVNRSVLGGKRGYIIYGWDDGVTLHSLIREISTPPMGKIIWSVARNIAALHSVGIAHRDVKPDNIIVILGDQETKLIDVGLACLESIEPLSDDFLDRQRLVFLEKWQAVFGPKKTVLFAWWNEAFDDPDIVSCAEQFEGTPDYFPPSLIGKSPLTWPDAVYADIYALASTWIENYIPPNETWDPRVAFRYLTDHVNRLDPFDRAAVALMDNMLNRKLTSMDNVVQELGNILPFERILTPREVRMRWKVLASRSLSKNVDINLNLNKIVSMGRAHGIDMRELEHVLENN